MLNIEQAERIAKLKIQLIDYKTQSRRKYRDAADMEEGIEKLKKKYREIEDGLQETSNTIRRRLERLPSKCKFRITYYEQAKSMFLNPQSSSALEHTCAAIRTAENRLISLRSDIEGMNKKIAATEDELRLLLQQTE